MKFTLLLALTISSVYAATGTVCSSGASVCDKDTECCGKATPSVAGSGTATTICQTKSLTAWVDTSSNDYKFACDKAAGSSKLFMGVVVVGAATYYLA